MGTITRGFVFALFVTFPFVALGQPATPTGSAGAKGAYTPPLGDFMLLAQTRHLKLWLAGNAGNWPLAEYEVDELKEGLEHAAELHPTLKDGTSVGQMIESIVMKPIDALDAAIKTGDRAKFVSAFDKVTEACNSCHQGANRPFLVVQRPSGSGQFPNQSFAPKK